MLCVFGIFFFPDLSEAIRGLWRPVRPGGLLAITIWGAKMFEPADARFWEAVRQGVGGRPEHLEPIREAIERPLTPDERRQITEAFS